MDIFQRALALWAIDTIILPTHIKCWEIDNNVSEAERVTWSGITPGFYTGKPRPVADNFDPEAVGVMESWEEPVYTDNGDLMFFISYGSTQYEYELEMFKGPIKFMQMINEHNKNRHGYEFTIRQR